MNVLASICFSRLPVDDVATSNVTMVHVPMATLDAAGVSGSASETWRADGTITHGQQNALRYWHGDELLFGLIQLPKLEFDTDMVRNAGKTPLQAAAERAYQEIFNLTDALGFCSILRFWNFLADINGHSHGTERDRQFNTGRQDGYRVDFSVQCVRQSR